MIEFLKSQTCKGIAAIDRYFSKWQYCIESTYIAFCFVPGKLLHQVANQQLFPWY
jgi:hypothetical protein